MESGCRSSNLSGDHNGIATDAIDLTAEEDSAKKIFSKYDENRDGVLDYNEFSTLLQSVFQASGMSDISEEKRRAFMSFLDSNKDGLIDLREFEHAWAHCFRKVLHPVTALIVVDVQYDFIDGSLALRNCPGKQDGAEVVPVINRLLKETQFDVVVYSMDWHPPSHISFVENVHKFPVNHTGQKSIPELSTYDEVEFDLSPPRSQVLWPTHCVQGSDGAKLDSSLTIMPGAVTIYKGTKIDIDSYSAFFDNMKLSQTEMEEELRRRNVTDVYVCGLAYDVCVAATSKDAVELGYRTVVIDDACRGVNTGDIIAAKQQLTDLGAIILNSDEAVRLVNKQDCSFDMGLFAAQTMPAAAV